MSASGSSLLCFITVSPSSESSIALFYQVSHFLCFIISLSYHCLWFINSSVLSLSLTSSGSSFALFFHCLSLPLVHHLFCFFTASGSSFALFYHCLSLPLFYECLWFIIALFYHCLSLPLVHHLLCFFTASGSSFALFYQSLSLPLFHRLLLVALLRSLQVQIRRRR